MSQVCSCLGALSQCCSDWLTCYFLLWAGSFLRRCKAQLRLSGTPRRLTGQSANCLGLVHPGFGSAGPARRAETVLPKVREQVEACGRLGTAPCLLGNPPAPPPVRSTLPALGSGTPHAERGAEDPSLSSEKVVPGHVPTQVPSHPRHRATETPRSARVWRRDYVTVVITDAEKRARSSDKGKLLNIGT